MKIKTFLKQHRLKISLTLLLAGIVGYYLIFLNTRVDYSADVKPILNRKCITCHGGVKKKGGFSLLFREEALSPTESGKPAIIPGDASHSEMIARLTSHDPEQRMPYQEEPLTSEEIDVLKRWVNQGAEFETHWAYQPVQKPAVPGSRFWSTITGKKTGNEIDQFIDEKLDEIGLERSEEADKRTLLRRVSLDLIGMPAPEPIAKSFLSDQSPAAYEKLVDQLLSSPKYGERWTALWMDLARYADTKGYERDYIRSIWRYRDWLIKSFNEDKPYDNFLIEQLAGDLLPNPSDDQFIATAYHRNTMNNDEGGTDNEEFRTAAIIDRVNTTWETLMGTSFACVQCHSHPYDPIRHDEYYKFMAFFNNSRDEDTYDEYPVLREFRNNSLLQFDSAKTWLKSKKDAATASYMTTLIRTGQQCINSLVADSMINSALEDTKFLRMRKASIARFKGIDAAGMPILMIRYRSPVKNGKLSFHPDSANATPIATAIIDKTEGGWHLMSIPIQSFKGKHDLYVRYTSPTLKNENENGMVFDWLVFTPSLPDDGSVVDRQHHKIIYDLINQPDAEKTPIMMDNPTNMYRKTQVFERGNWLLKTKEVKPGLPGIFTTSYTLKQNNRLGLAMWMTDKQNPLTARTMVNRLWEQLFGTGLVETLEDLGSQGASPTHQELLDYLSYTFMHEDQWSIKKMLKRMVLASTYKQSSLVNKESQDKDPLNRFYSHAPRIRLTAEQIRDQALAITGTLSDKMYGPSVMPYQPEGIWKSPYDERKWSQSTGEDLYRRSIYTYWKRTSPYPSMVTFDGTAREVCLTRRIRTNTPLQALTVLNDSTYWDLSVRLAQKLHADGSIPGNDRIAKGYELATGKRINADRNKILTELYRKTLFQLSDKDDRIKSLIADSVLAKNSREIAALSVVTSAILNLDEVITKN